MGLDTLLVTSFQNDFPYTWASSIPYLDIKLANTTTNYFLLITHFSSPTPSELSNVSKNNLSVRKNIFIQNDDTAKTPVHFQNSSYQSP